MNSFSNMKIGKKLGVVFGAVFLLIVCLMLLALHTVYSLKAALHASEQEGRIMTVAEKVSADQGAIAQRVATMVVAGQPEQEIMAQLLAIRKNYMTVLDELKSLPDAEEGKLLLSNIVNRATEWREADNHLISLLKDGRLREAITFHQGQVVPRFNANGTVIAEYRAYRSRMLTDIDKQTDLLISRSVVILVAVGFTCLLLSAGCGLLLTRSIANPLTTAITHLGEIAKGDLTKDAPPEFRAREDEIGTLARAKQTMIDALRKMVQEISTDVQVLSLSSTELSEGSGQMAENSRRAADQSHAVSAATEEMSANVVSVAAGIEQTTTNLAHVSSATGQMTATIGEIATNSEKARRITTEASKQANRITEQMQQLGHAAKEIDKVTETINEISSQTSLLALNATIEAARAGSAGKGFAVVANEIKELAQQTASSTEDIKARIAGVQTSASAGISEIEKVSGIIHEVSDLVNSIAAAIEEQSTVARDISQNISEASTGVADANSRFSQTSLATQEIAREIGGVDATTKQMADGSGRVQNSAEKVSKVAEQLQTVVSRFRVG
jgi:methyl-accepting chemotaxis protein